MRSMVFSVLLGFALAACGKTADRRLVRADAGVTGQASAPPPSASMDVGERLPICGPWIVTELAVPRDWKTYPIVATSGPETRISARSADHYVDELVDVSVGPFVLRYWHGVTRPSAGGLELRLAGCKAAPLPIDALTYWNGGSVVLRKKDNVFIVSAAGSNDQLIAVVRRLPE